MIYLKPDRDRLFQRNVTADRKKSRRLPEHAGEAGGYDESEMP